VSVTVTDAWSTAGITSFTVNAPVPLAGDTVYSDVLVLTAVNVPLYPASLAVKFCV